MSLNNSRNVYEIITEKIIARIEKDGVLPWKKPWKLSADGGGFPRNLISGKLYRGINCLVLGCSEFESPYWVTFKQCVSLGGTVKAGEKGTPVVYWKMVEKSEQSEGKSALKKYPLLRYSTAFNTDQCEGLKVPPVKWCDLTAEGMADRCKRLVEGFQNRPVIKAGFPAAAYLYLLDEIRLPHISKFCSSEEYFCTLFHELIHSTGHPKRLARLAGEVDTASDAFERYGKEELVAEIGASFLCAEAGISPATFENSVSYLRGWIDTIKADPRVLIDAASQAQKACDLVLNRTAFENPVPLENAA